MARKSRIVLGLNSGTSADGVDAVACAIAGRGLSMKVSYLGHASQPYSAELRRRVLSGMAPAKTDTEEICRLETSVGATFAAAAETAKKKLGLKRIDLVGSHGQTICHLPPRKIGYLTGLNKRSTAETAVPQRQANASKRSAETGTLQIGDPSIIAARMRCPVVHHFRQADMAVGGQGAPLVPWTDYVLFRDTKKPRVVQNIGGIANLTYLPARGGVEQVIAFDTGPGNMVIDALARHFTRGREKFDRDGRRATRGKANMEVLAWMLKHPFFAALPPKSCGREDFGEGWTQALLKRFGRLRLGLDDWLATATCLTAFTIALGCELARWLSKKNIVQTAVLQQTEMIVCGGGTNNFALVNAIHEALGAMSARGSVIQMTTTDDYGIPSQAKEGVSFAMLAAACVDRVPANLPQVTGARRRVVLGQICDVGGET